jgi:hypothetical protein
MEPARFTHYGELGEWAKIDREELKAQMLWAFHNRKDALALGKKASEYVKTTFTWEEAGRKAVKALKDRRN